VADEENNEVKQEAASTSEKKPFTMVLLLLNTIALGTVAFFQFRFMQMEQQKPDLTELLKQSEDMSAEAEAEAKVVDALQKEKLITLEGFTVNLAQGDGPRRFVRLNAVLKLDDSTNDKEIEARKPQIRDTIISILNTKRPEDLLKKEGKLYLKEEIRTAINSFLIDGNVVDVFYIGFQIN
jgi:flagellar FliL protein